MKNLRCALSFVALVASFHVASADQIAFSPSSHAISRGSTVAFVTPPASNNAQDPTTDFSPAHSERAFMAPEPNSLLLLGTGLLGAAALAFRVRGRRSA